MMYTPVHIAWHYGGSSGTVLPLGRVESEHKGCYRINL